VAGVDKFVFKKIEARDLVDGSLVLATQKDKITSARAQAEIKFPDGATAFWVYRK
jgi:hypothetical protein